MQIYAHTKTYRLSIQMRLNNDVTNNNVIYPLVQNDCRMLLLASYYHFQRILQLLASIYLTLFQTERRMMAEFVLVCTMYKRQGRHNNIVKTVTVHYGPNNTLKVSSPACLKLQPQLGGRVFAVHSARYNYIYRSTRDLLRPE